MTRPNPNERSNVGMIDEQIRRVLDGDVDAYGKIVREYQGMLLGYASNRLSNPQLAQEVVQLTFIRAYNQIADFRIGEDFGVWLCVICRYMILTELERMRRQSRNQDKYREQFEVELSTSMTEFEIDDKEPEPAMLALRNCLKSLRAEAASLMDLRYNKKKSCKEIAEKKSRTVTWVTSNLSRVRQALRRCIEGQAKDTTS